MSKWRNTTWGNISTLEYGRALRGYQNSTGNVRVYGTNGPVGWTAEVQSDGPGVIIGRKGAYRGVHYSPGPFWVIDTAYYLVPTTGLHLRWAYYYLRGQDINSLDSGSAIPSTSRSDFYAMPVVLPPIHEQAAIADVLGALDDKIAHNERIYACSVNLADSYVTRALLDVRTQMDRKLQGDGNELKPPPGWYLSSLAEICDRGGGGIQTGPFGSQLHASDYTDNGVPVVMPQDIGNNIIRTNAVARTSRHMAERLCRHELRVGDIIYSRRGDVERRALVREQNQGWLCGTGCLRIRPGVAINSYYLSYYLGLSTVREWIVRHAIGATMPNLNTRILGELPVLVPPESTNDWLTGVLAALDAELVTTTRENTTIAELRDMILPKLISGEVRVREAEKVVEEVL